MARRKASAAKAVKPIKPSQRWQAERLVDMSGGRNTLVPADLLNDNESPSAQHTDLSLKGIVRPAKGRSARYGAAFATGGVKGIGAFYKSDGTTRMLCGVGAQLYYDTPHLVTKWAARADFGQAGTSADPMVSEPSGGGLTLQTITWQAVENLGTWQDVLDAT